MSCGGLRGRLADASLRAAVSGTAVVLGALFAIAPSPALGASATYTVGPIREISAAMRGQNAEVEQAVDPSGRFVYEEWIGTNWIGFARSTDGGRHFGKPIVLRGSSGGWDPALSVASNGTAYAAFMVTRGARSYPVVLSSKNDGASFSRPTALRPGRKFNWGDRDFIAAGPGSSVFVTWDYGPSSRPVSLTCPAAGSCGFSTGDLNVVSQTSTNGGATFGPMAEVSPGYPASGADSAPLLVEPSGRIDVLFQRYTMGKRYRLGVASSYFTSSSDGGHTWSQPVKVGGSAGTMSPGEWWIDGDVTIDSGGNLYATWDTQTRRHDIGWLAYSTDHGATWSAPRRISPNVAKVPHIMQVAGGPPGIAYAAWLTVKRHHGYAEYLRTFSIARGWLSKPRRISRRFGATNVWPGDTFGISTLSPTRLMLSWGSAIHGTAGNSEIFVTRVSVGLPSSP